jgi:hypothetical protein
MQNSRLLLSRKGSEALEATAIGRALADRLSVPFHFASPDNPNNDLPRWWTGKA